MTALVPKSARILAVAPSHAYDEVRLAAGLEIVRAHGHTIEVMPGALQPHRYFAGSDAHRRDQLVHALTSSDVDAVWMIRGGSGMNRLLADLPWDALPQRPLIGFSDTTPLLEALRVRGKGRGIHGPVLHSLPNTTEQSIAHLFALLAGEPLPPLPGETWVGGSASGPLVGGNLCTLTSNCGTPFQLNASGAIVVLEEIGEHPYRIDRMLVQCRDSGSFDGAVGFGIGSFTSCEPPPSATYTLRDMLLEILEPLDVPILGNLPIGHGPENHAFEVGASGRLSDGALHLSLALA